MNQTVFPTYSDMSIDGYASIIDLWKECNIRIETEDEKGKFAKFIQNPQSKGFIAKTNNDLIGAVLCGSDGRYGYIHHLAVKTEYRHQQIGNTLVAKCKEFLGNELGIDAIAVFVWNSNVDGQAFWLHAGFEKAVGLEVLAFNTQKQTTTKNL